MKVGDSVRPKHDLYNRGIGIIIKVEPSVKFPNGQIADARYWVLYAKGFREVAIGLALEKI